LLILCILIGAGLSCFYFEFLLIYFSIGGIALCAVYFSKSFSFLIFKYRIVNKDTNTSTQGWKIAGIVLGILTILIGIILILLSIFKQIRNRAWRNKYEEGLFSYENYVDDVDQLNIENNTNNREEVQTRETASSPLPDPDSSNDLIYCPNCNRLQPNDHQCVFSTPNQPISNQPERVSMAIQTEENTVQPTTSHTIIDRSKKRSTTTETQTNELANSVSNITEDIIYKRVPIPTTAVTVQQPTKVVIVRVPNTAGELILQPKATTTNGK
jgi:hypothetical protein